MSSQSVTIVAGPCSVDEKNIEEIHQIAEMKVSLRGKKVSLIAGTRVVGLKSRTDLNGDGKGMGMDFDVYMKNTQILLKGGSIADFDILPSAKIAESIHKKTGILIATEVMSPLIQLPSFVGRIGKKALLPWNPAVNQLGWQVAQMAEFARSQGWHIGLKNGKWIGDHLHSADSQEYTGQTTMEKAWMGLVKYAGTIDGDIVLIHRGVDVPGKGNYRSAPTHVIAKRVKQKTGVKLFFDPSHSFGPKMREHIPSAVVDVMAMKQGDNEYLYDGVLIEVGTSSTDTDQHISISELKWIGEQISAFRPLAARPKN